MMMKKTLILLIGLTMSICIGASDLKSPIECQGSLRPYPVPSKIYTYPDSLTPIFINHVGRHGSRYPAGSAFCRAMKYSLNRADSMGTITPLGLKFLEVVDRVMHKSEGKWGALDSLGMSEQRGIAQRMYQQYVALLKTGVVRAISSSSPRVVMSMYSFVHELAEETSALNTQASSGPEYNYLMRPFDVNNSYIDFMAKGEWKQEYEEYLNITCPLGPIRNLLGAKYPATDDELRSLAMNEYYIIAGMSAMGEKIDYRDYLSLKEYNQLWSIFNIRQYLQRTATTISSIPADIAIPLVENIVNVGDSVVDGKLSIKAQFRFGHAETLMPLLSLLQIKGAYYLTHYFDTVEDNWQDYNVVPMASNLQFIYFKAPSGQIYVRTELNEVPIHLIPGHEDIYLPWKKVREYFLSFTQYMF